MPSKDKALVTRLQREQRYRKKALLIEYFKTHPCVDCGESDFRCLDFDHLRDKHKNISVMMRSGYSWGSVMREAEKCEVRCANCHRKKSYERLSGRYSSMDRATRS
jgi:hypothetical protein